MKLNEFKDSDIIALSDLKTEGFYWIANTSDCDSGWFLGWISGEPSGEDSEGVDTPYWSYGLDADDVSYDLDEDYVFLGPIDAPEVAIPIAAPKEPLQFTKVPVVLPTLPILKQLLPLPTLTPLKR